MMILAQIVSSVVIFGLGFVALKNYVSETPAKQETAASAQAVAAR